MSTYDELHVQHTMGIEQSPLGDRYKTALHAALKGRDVDERRMFLEQIDLLTVKKETA